MKFIFSFLFFVIFSVAIKAQSLDYARDVFFNDTLKPAKDYYYQYSPLLSTMEVYRGKGLNVVILCSESTPMNIARKNIELETSYDLNRPYLCNLNTFHTLDKFHEFISKNKVDVIIIEDIFIKDLGDLLNIYSNRIFVFNGESKLFKKPVFVENIRPWWHFTFKMDSISTELIKVWRFNERYRTFLVMIERTKNFTVTIHKRWTVIIFFSLFALMVLNGYYQRIKRSRFSKTLIPIFGFVIVFLCSFMFISIQTYQDFTRSVLQFKNKELKDLNEVLILIDSKEPLAVVIGLRSLTERLISNTEEAFFQNHTELLTEKLKLLTKHSDERVRMWSLTVISKLKNESLINWVAQEDWSKESDYLVRTRVVRVLATLSNNETDKALLQMKSYEKHPYVFGELRVICLERNLWSQGESVDTVYP